LVQQCAQRPTEFHRRTPTSSCCRPSPYARVSYML
jgi:hypothetical protein